MWRHRMSNNVCIDQYRQRRYTFLTVVGLGILLGAFFIAYGASGTSPQAQPTLKLLQIIFRHGDRTPVFTYANDPYKDKAWEGGKGALTNKGKMEIYELAQVMRIRYAKFLNEAYDPDEIEMQSSYSPRCQMSAQMFLAGMYPPKGRQIWNLNLLWQPIPVNPIPRFLDNKIAMKAECKAFDIEKAKVDREMNANLSAEDKKTLAFLSEKTGENISTLAQAEPLFYTLQIENDNGLNLPSWVDKVFPAQLAMYAGAYLASFTKNDKLKRLQAGPMMKEWIDHIKEIDKHPKRKAYYYSGHDVTIVAVTRALGYELPEVPMYGSTLMIEYHESPDAPGDGFIQLYFFKKTNDRKIYPLTLPWCEFSCPLKQFEEGIQKYLPNDWNAECQN